jgi:hypothetical protein
MRDLCGAGAVHGKQAIAMYVGAEGDKFAMLVSTEDHLGTVVVFYIFNKLGNPFGVALEVIIIDIKGSEAEGWQGRQQSKQLYRTEPLLIKACSLRSTI